MQRDVDLRLIFLIVLVVVAIVFLTIFYQYSFEGLIDKYEAMRGRLNSTEKNLTETKVNLDICQGLAGNVSQELNQTLVYQERSREEYNKIYQQTETQLTKTKGELNSTKKALSDTTGKLIEKTNELNAKLALIQNLNKEISDLNKDIKRYKDDLDDLEDDINDCKNAGGLCTSISW